MFQLESSDRPPNNAGSDHSSGEGSEENRAKVTGYFDTPNSIKDTVKHLLEILICSRQFSRNLPNPQCVLKKRKQTPMI
uniref:SSX2IP n=1 Tax=Heterorhabditis bacteriophora TaxID=37862 RepID=A0A1I7XFB2_HETBA